MRFHSLSRSLSALLAGFALTGSMAVLHADVRLPKVFGSHMVLQQDKPITIWGWANPGETVTVEFRDSAVKAQANPAGEWKAVLPAPKAGAPSTLTVKGSSTVTFEDVLVGEVWLCSGQSNMEMGIGMVQNGKEEIAAANYPQIRLLMVANKWTPEPQSDFEGEWKVCSPETLGQGGWGGFSAAGYFFGRQLHKELGVAVGLIDATWGGTCVESWTPPQGFAAVPTLKDFDQRVQLGDPRAALHQQKLGEFLDQTEQWLNQSRAALKSNKIVPTMPMFPAELLPPHELQNPTALFNGMIHPVCPFAIRGAIWYQGESNLDNGAIYCDKMKALIAGWRQIWAEGEFPFFFVQIAPYNYGGDAERMGDFWEAQSAAAKIPNVGMAVTTDIGNLKDIHPANKQEVGRRLALLALANTYGKKDVICSGPTFKAMQADGDKLRVTFDNAGTGLASRDGQPLNWFEIIDADEGGFVQAQARIDGNSVVLSSPEVKRPVALRFAWSMLAEPNLMNSAGLPASAFRAGTVPKRDLLALKVPEAKQYELVYDLDLAKLGENFSYDIDNSKKITRPFDRVAYFVELQRGGRTDFVYVSMDAFTDSLGKIGVPTVASGARFQQDVSHLNVISNVKGITTGANLAGGNLEFWPNNYAANNEAKVPNASGQTYDFGDQATDPVDGYGSMQVHNHNAKQTLFAINHWKAGAGGDLGIGNQPKNNPDWTFANNAGSYQARRLRVLVHCK